MNNQRLTVTGLFLIVILGLIWIAPDQSSSAVIPGWHTTVFMYDFFGIFYNVFYGLILIQVVLLIVRQLSVGLERRYPIIWMNNFNWVILIFGAVCTALTIYIFIIQPIMNGIFQEQMAFYCRTFGQVMTWYLVRQYFPVLSQLFWFQKIRQDAWWTILVCMGCLIPGIFGSF